MTPEEKKASDERIAELKRQRDAVKRMLREVRAELQKLGHRRSGRRQ